MANGSDINDGNPADAAAEGAHDEINVGVLFAGFLAANPYSLIEKNEKAGGALAVQRPWGDDSLIIPLKDPSAMADVLNHVILPQRFSAIYHVDSKVLEVLWTAFSIAEPYLEVVGREFDFEYKGNTHRCSYAAATDRLMSIAKHAIPNKQSSTNFRNIQSFGLYSNIPSTQRAKFSNRGPICFHVSNIDWDEAAVIDLTSHLSFYMRYFDDKSPVVLTHDIDKGTQIDRTRYLRGAFPQRIKARQLDENLLSFWNFTGQDPSQNTMIHFILYYRIIEYSAFHYVDATIRAELRRIIMAPDFSPEGMAAVDKIISAVSISKLEEVSRFRAVIQHCVRPELLWADVSKNLKYFSKDTKFEGGFTAKRLITEKETVDTFDAGRVAVFSDIIRKIRNTLSHGKDQETSGVILPTLQNFNLLRPWVHLIATAAGEVVLNKDLT